ncbi:DUF2321 domain-containing protein [uncultured Pontibacter sp.]|uniref:DUF2321 domain-containing protein n=1 Tax=uncultured Pontibacter sp. TaxID=453356 RepID=UPI002624A930|nr:DUF2321 domain-containing protein [uncultured Pontibacter sp.]
MNYYDVAQICLNGHVITPMAQTSPNFQQKFCNECGEKTVMNCQSCGSLIKGFYHVTGVIGLYDYEKPKFCENCGTPYTWTERQQNAANELIDFSEKLSEAEKEDFKASVNAIIRNSTNSNVAQLKFKKYIASAGSEIAKGMRDIFIDVVSESVRKSIWGN